MDSALSTAARALATGDPLLALKHVALRGDPAALALRGIALAQLGQLPRARALLRRAAAAFGEAEPVARARCVVAQGEVALMARDLQAAAQGLEQAAQLLARRGEHANAAFARLVLVRRFVLLGSVDAAERELLRLRLERAPARLRAIAGLLEADIALKRLKASVAQAALERAREAAKAAAIPPLVEEVERAWRRAQAPIARLVSAAGERAMTLAELEPLFGSGDLVVDAGRREARLGSACVTLASRPVLLALLVALARQAPAGASRQALIEAAFGARRSNESHRARLRVEVGRLRKLLRSMAELSATPEGFALAPRRGRAVRLLLPPGDGEASELFALLAGGEPWSTSALATALGKSQRSVQRALGQLEADGKVRSSGAGRARRWVAAPSTGFATTLLLVARGSLG